MFSTRMKLALIAGTSAVALLAAGCSNSQEPSDATSTTSSATMPGMDHGSMTSSSAQAATRTDFNDADVTFLQMMYPHHAQAVDMAKLVPSRSQNQELITLAANVEKAQSPEMQQITTLLAAFGKPAPSADMGGHHMDGMMTDQQMKDLAGMSGTAFDKMWMQMMIEHHKGAVTMAQTELANGANADAKAMAQAIISGQQAEIDQMTRMLTQS
ncbi:DUF305 domain-containing protein [Nocardia huaxiensis]|uniref:DUF305 domain-containing protein n=1 Tax=Nocardia huaxiensis TaxID=2755382 RepID=UPI001E350BD8|nr:DUF305 domain-containing protein [Nocardia huaxiensis]UFS93616.1 DUF305 domain-containing protein [Nocardia huaxiensis]